MFKKFSYKSKGKNKKLNNKIFYGNKGGHGQKLFAAENLQVKGLAKIYEKNRRKGFDFRESVANL